MTTFSQMVEDMVAESRRKDMLLDIEKYINQTIRDVHFNTQNDGLVKFGDNRREALVFASQDVSHVWPIPQPQNFARLEVIYCPDVDQVAIERNPAQMHQLSNPNGNPLWYRTGPAIAISGFGQSGSPIQISYLAYPRRLVYQKPADRLILWDAVNEQYVYHESIVTPEQMEDAYDKAANWLLERWSDVIREGVRAKLYKKLADEGRTRTAYSAFESGRKALVAAESFDMGATYHR